MTRIRFEALVEVYRNSRFAAQGDEAVLRIASQAVVDLLQLVEADEDAAADAGIVLLDDIADVAVGAVVRIRVDAPRTGIGILAGSLDVLLNSPRARVEQPLRYFLVDQSFSSNDPNVPDAVARYRKVLALINLFAESASFLDRTRGELVFVKDGRVVVPIRYDAAALGQLNLDDAERLLDQFRDDLHEDQKLEILFEAMIDLCRSQRADARFEFALRNLGDLADAVRNGYRMFASNFSYSKIRGELEDARISYTQKIHKTIVDIQGQLLGIPVATVVVASQMKPPTSCGVEFWVNWAVLLGAWIFVALLLIAVANQWLTLNVIKDEVARQKRKMLTDHAAVGGEFVGMFNSLVNRIRWHHGGLVAVSVVGVVGAGMATCFTYKIASMPVQQCASPPANGSAGTGKPSTATTLPARGAPIAEASPARRSATPTPHVPHRSQ